MSSTAHSYAAARAICRRHARSFYFASYFLPQPKRDRAYAVYAFCRLLDDATDEGPAADRAAAVGRFVGLLDDCYAGPAGDVVLRPGTPPDAREIVPAFVDVIRACGIPKGHFLDLAEGCRMDLAPAVRYATWPELETYCYHVAGVVGLIMACVFELPDPSARALAVRMGNAMQLTNILRDVGEDWARGRLYLPAEDLARFGYAEADVAGRVVDERFVALMRFEIARARQMYADAARGLCKLPDDGSRLTACAMAVIYAGILRAIERRRYDVYAGRAHLTTFQKLLRIPRAIKLARREDGEPLPDVW